MAASRAGQISSNNAIRGALTDETYSVFQDWDFTQSRQENLARVRQGNTIGAASGNWAEKVARAINRRFDPAGRDHALVELAQAGCDREVWKPLLLFHITRDEFLLRDFLVHWLYPQFAAGSYRLHSDDVIEYLHTLAKKKLTNWSQSTTQRVASGLLNIAAEFGLLTGIQYREFSSYHLPDTSFLYLLHTMADGEPSAQRIVASEDWYMYLMAPADVERELLRLHQYRQLHYEAAGSLVQLKLPCESARDYARSLSR